MRVLIIHAGAKQLLEEREYEDAAALIGHLCTVTEDGSKEGLEYFDNEFKEWVTLTGGTSSG